VQALLPLLAAAITLTLPQRSQGQQVQIISVAGGSTALLGNFTPSRFHPGAVPKIIEYPLFKITGYRDPSLGESESGVLIVNSSVAAGNIEVSDPNGLLENVRDAMIRCVRIPDPGGDPANDILRILIFLRSDSGNGVRYVANSARITKWPNPDVIGSFRLRNESPPARPPYTFTDNLGFVGTAIVNAVLAAAGNGSYDASTLKIGAGYSDATADTVVRYANFPNLNVQGLAPTKIEALQGPIQTLLLIYNQNGVYGPSGPKVVVFPRSVVQCLLNTTCTGSGIRWNSWDSDLSANVVFANRRNKSSGTRLAEYVAIQRVLPASPLGFVDDNIPNQFSMLSVLCNSTSAFGYAFVTGTAARNNPQCRVGGYKDSAGNVTYPYANTTNPDVSLPENNGQRRYDANLYYNIATPGSNPLWSYTTAIVSKDPGLQASAQAQRDIFTILRSAHPAAVAIVHLEGLTSASDMQVGRNYFVSSITGEQVTDGQRIVPLANVAEVPEPDGDDPQLHLRRRAAKARPMANRKPRADTPQR
jgi:hypothetical protein